jgi:DNA-binding GntR family transcriptional regulator
MGLLGDPVPHKQLHRVVSEKIRMAIINGVYHPGEWLRQKRIAEDLGVSQMPVREALKELAADGLVEHIPYRGVRVVQFSPDDVADLYAQRCCLEKRAARAAAQNITKEDLIELRELQSQMEESFSQENLEEYRQLNRHFHQMIYRTSGRTYLIRVLDQMWSAFPSMLWSTFIETESSSLPDRDRADIFEHQMIIVALEQRDPERAERSTCQHIEAAGSQLVKTLRSNL